MYRVYGKPPASEFIDLSNNAFAYIPPYDSGRIRLYGTEGKVLKVRWADGTISEIATGAFSQLQQNKNRIINGDFSIWQRGNSFNVQTPRQYTADRFFASAKSGKHIVEKATLEGFNALKSTITVPPDIVGFNNTYLSALAYYFEGQHLYDIWTKGNSVVLSFLFQSNFSGIFGGSLRNWTDPSVQVQSYVFEWTYTTPGQTQRITIPIPPHNFNPAPRNDENLGFVLALCAVSGSLFTTSTVGQWIDGDKHTSTNASASNWAQAVGNYVIIAQLQLEEGSTATDFEYVPQEIQLLRCMRYWETSFNQQVDPNVLIPADLTGKRGFGTSASGTGQMFHTTEFIVPKRVTPTVTIYSPGTGIEGDVDIDGGTRLAGTVANVSRFGFEVQVLDTATTKSQMFYHFIANAEL